MERFANQKSAQLGAVSAVQDATAAAFHEIITETGMALARGQEALDAKWIETHQMRLSLIEAGGPTFMPPAPVALVIPEATLDLQLEIRGTLDQDGQLQLIGAPQNPTASLKRNANVSVSSHAKLTFRLLPVEETREAAPPAPPALSGETALQNGTEALLAIAEGLASPGFRARYRRHSRKWSVELLDGPDVRAIVLVDDSTGKVLNADRPIDPEATVRRTYIEPIGEPAISELTPVASEGDAIRVVGENLGGFDLSATRVEFAGEGIVPAELSLEALHFTVDDRMASGRVRVTTAKGTAESEELLIVPTPRSLEPASGFYDPVRRTGSLFKLVGANLSREMELEFAGGSLVPPERVEGPNVAWFQVPEEAHSGPISLVVRRGDEIHRHQLQGPVFQLRPHVRNVKPKEARAGEQLTIVGNHLDQVNALRIGARTFPLDGSDGTLAVRSERTLVVEVPVEAGDGALAVVTGELIVETGVLFYQVPAVVDFPALARRGQALAITGTGFGSHRESLRVRFLAESGYVFSEALYLEDASSEGVGLQRLGVLVPDTAVSGTLAVVRAEIANPREFERTTAGSGTALLIWQAGTEDESIRWSDASWETWTP